MTVPAPRLPQAVLRVADLAASVAFYRDGLGLAIESHDPAAGTAVVLADGGVRVVLAAPRADLAPWPGVPESAAGAWVYLQRPGLPALAAELAERGVPRSGPREPYPGLRQLQVEDPDGYVVEFWEPLPLSDAQVLDLCRAGPDRLAAALAGLGEADLDLARAPGKWTIRQIVHHVAEAELGTFHVLYLALVDPGRTVQPNLWDNGAAMAQLDSARRPVGPAVALFGAARAWALAAVAHLPGALEREVAWPSGYRARVRRLLQQLGGHAMHHILQIEETRQRHGR